MTALRQGLTSEWYPLDGDSPESGLFHWFVLGFLEDLECGKTRVTTKEITPGKPTTRRYSKEENDQAVRPVLEVCTELGTTQGTVLRIADQLGNGTESLRRRLPGLRSPPGL